MKPTRLNDALFGDATEAELVIGEDGEYIADFELKKKNKKNEDQSASPVVVRNRRRSSRTGGAAITKNVNLQASTKLSREGTNTFSNSKQGKKRKRNVRK